MAEAKSVSFESSVVGDEEAKRDIGNENTDTSNENVEDGGKRYFGYTKKQLITIIIFGLANLFSNTVFSLQAPFYPKEAESKGATATEYGFVFGVFQLVIFIMSPIYGYVIGIVKPRLVFNIGILTTGTTAILFGFLHYIDDHLTFIALSFVLRIIQACGDAAFVCASFTCIASEFPECVAETFAIFETCCGLGLIIGPSLGGALYEAGGFLLPFDFMGGCLFMVAVLTYFLLPEVGLKIKDSKASDKKSGIVLMLKIPTVLLAFFSVFISASSIGFLTATLEPHLRENFNLTPGITGLIFIIDGGMYALCAPVTGRLVDRSGNPKLFTLLGAVLTFVGFLLIGPAPFIPLQTTIWLVCVGLVIHGTGMSSSLVSAFLQAQQESVKNGFPDDITTQGQVSGLWLSFFAIGCFIGPSIGGVLLDNYGFKISTLYVLATNVVVIFLASISLCTPSKKSKSTSGSEKESLLKAGKESDSEDVNQSEGDSQGESTVKSYGAI